MSASWDIQPDLFVEVVTKDSSKMQRGMAITILNNLQILSPVKTGRYRSNHILSFDSPDLSYTENTGGMSMAFNSILGMSDTAIPTIYIQNNLPYSIPLENGSSIQAPLGVYDLAYEAAVAAYT